MSLVPSQDTTIAIPPPGYCADFTCGQYTDEPVVINTCRENGQGYNTKGDFCFLKAHVKETLNNLHPPMQLSEDETEEHLFGVILASYYSLKKGIEFFGDKATNATSAELENIHRMGTYKPMDSTKLTLQK